MLKYLRIAVTVLSLTACLLFIALWQVNHQFWYHACWTFSDSQHFFVDSDVRFRIAWRFKANPCGGTFNFRSLKVYPDEVESQERHYEKLENVLGIRFKPANTNIAVTVPHWLAGLIVLTFAIVPWIRWRFSLLTLLIATTLVAVALGLVVAAT